MITVLVCKLGFNQDEMIDFFDISGFYAAYSNGKIAADLTGDGAVDFFEVLAFLQAFSNGFPEVFYCNPTTVAR